MPYAHHGLAPVYLLSVVHNCFKGLQVERLDYHVDSRSEVTLKGLGIILLISHNKWHATNDVGELLLVLLHHTVSLADAFKILSFAACCCVVH